MAAHRLRACATWRFGAFSGHPGWGRARTWPDLTSCWYRKPCRRVEATMSSPVSFACIYLGTVRLLQGCPAAPGRRTVGPAGRRGLVRGTDFVAESDIVKQDAKGPVRRKHNETKPDRHQQRPGSGSEDGSAG